MNVNLVATFSNTSAQRFTRAGIIWTGAKRSQEWASQKGKERRSIQKDNLAEEGLESTKHNGCCWVLVNEGILLNPRGQFHQGRLERSRRDYCSRVWACFHAKSSLEFHYIIQHRNRTSANPQMDREVAKDCSNTLASAV